MDYNTLLERAKKNLPEIANAKERFEIPKVKGHIEGNKTIVTNFQPIVSTLRRDEKHILKYLLRELASPGTIDGPRLIIGRKINSAIINEKIIKYANEFVICKECGKPDTQTIKEGQVLMLKCTACGAKHPIKSKV
jgi:translation initiation factor 2 subunit 2